MSTQSALYSRLTAEAANLTLSDLELKSWDAPDIIALQKKVKAKPADGWFGSKSLTAWKAWSRAVGQSVAETVDNDNGVWGPGQAIIGGVGHTPPPGVRIVNFEGKGGIPAQTNDTSERKQAPTQFVFHRGWAGSYKAGINYAAKTEETLDARGLSTTFSMDIDGTIYQHMDPSTRRGRHATHHNVQSDSLDIGGPFELSRTGAPGQKPLTIKMAIGRTNDKVPPLKRSYGTVKCWSLTPEQEAALILFVPWWCQLRGIPLTACSDWRTFRIAGGGLKDPVTNVKGLVAHTQVSEPGARVDGILPLIVLKEARTPIVWRSAEEFLNG